MRFVPFALPLVLAACRSTELASSPAPTPAPVPEQATEQATEQAPQPAPSADARVDVIPLAYAVADELSEVVSRALARRRNSSLMVVADPRTNSLLVSGRASELAEVRKLVAELDVEVEKAR